MMRKHLAGMLAPALVAAAAAATYGAQQPQQPRATAAANIRSVEADEATAPSALAHAAEGDAPSSARPSGSVQGGNQNSTPLPPLTDEQKFRFGLRQAFLRPGAYIGPTFAAAFRRRQELDVPAKTRGDDVADYFSDYARSFGTGATTELFGSGVYPVIFRQDPRYSPPGKNRSRASRALYAASRAIITRGDDGTTQPNYSRFAGAFTGAALANIWERDTPRERNSFGVVTEINDRRGVAPTFRRFGLSIGFNALSLALNELLGFSR